MARNARIYILVPQGFADTTSQRVMRHENQEVQKVQPVGCPRNGTMGMCYVQVAETGEFIGLVNLSSLVALNKTAPVRDLAAEARDQRSMRYRRAS